MKNTKTTRVVRAVLFTAVSVAAVWGDGTYQVDCGGNGVMTANFSCPSSCQYSCNLDTSNTSCTCTTYLGRRATAAAQTRQPFGCGEPIVAYCLGCLRSLLFIRPGRKIALSFL